ncbi:MAG: ABC transporter ATP-binding protein [Helicobacteraceae bacterium]|nr:ABC transporter ATP-binding protein [Helicobacteraceae bacterium]
MTRFTDPTLRRDQNGRSQEDRNAEDFLAVDNLTVHYKSEGYLIAAVKRVGFSAAKGERLILLGRSGCGKSTILKAIGGFIKPTSGSIRLDGKPIEKPDSDRAMVFQEFDQLMPWKTALENIAFAIRNARKLGGKEAKVEARRYLKKVGLEKFGDSYPHQLSGGMKQRVAIARALAAQAKALLMDEPFAALDALTRSQMQEELLRLYQEEGFTLAFVTHSIDEALILGSKIVMLSPHPGEVIETIKLNSSAASGALKEKINAILFKDRVEYVI